MKPSNHFQTLVSVFDQVGAPFQPKTHPRQKLADEIEVREQRWICRESEFCFISLNTGDDSILSFSIDNDSLASEKFGNVSGLRNDSVTC